MKGFTRPSMAFEWIFQRPSGYFQLIIGLLCTSIIQFNGAVDLGKCLFFFYFMFSLLVLFYSAFGILYRL